MSRGAVVATAAAGVTVVALALLVPSTSGKGSEMDEGAVMAYSALVLDGLVPHRDFLTFYGPGNLWIVAGAFTVAGTSVATERAVGLAYRLILILSLLVLASRLGGLLGGVLAALVAAKMLSRELIWAYATYGAIAFGVLGLAVAALGAESEPRRQRLSYAAAGVAGGVAVLIRFEFALAIIASSLPLLAVVPGRTRWWYAGGFLISAGLYVPHLALVGPDRLGRLAGDLIATRPGRALPLPHWSTWIAVLLVVGVVLALGYVALGAFLWRRDQDGVAPRVTVAFGIFALALLPTVLFRPDSFHIRPFATLAIGLLPAVALLVVRRWAALPSSVRLTAGVAVAVASTYPILAEVRQSAQLVRHGQGVVTSTREFFNDERRLAGRVVLARTRALTRPGESLFVGPHDLRRTNYGDTFMYFLLRELRPASYYMEMNPWTANREGSGLADDLRRADWLILSTAWDEWDEPNTSVEYGSPEPNRVVRDAFCLRFEREPFRLYERCDR